VWLAARDHPRVHHTIDDTHYCPRTYDAHFDSAPMLNTGQSVIYNGYLAVALRLEIPLLQKIKVRKGNVF
jgi:hypothetical protein